MEMRQRGNRALSSSAYSFQLTSHTSHQVGKAQQKLCFLRKLEHAHLPHHPLTIFYQSATESLPTDFCTVGLPAAEKGTVRTLCRHWGRYNVSSAPPSLSETFTIKSKRKSLDICSSSPGRRCRLSIYLKLLLNVNPRGCNKLQI